MVQQGTRQTVAEFEAFLALPENRDRNFELIDGEIIEMMPTEEHGEIAAFFTIEIGIYLKQNPIGVVGLEVRHRMPGDDLNSLLPDVSVRKDIDRPRIKKGAVPDMPPLAIEIKSADDTFRLMRRKAEYYLQNGSQLVWLVFPENKQVEVYVPDADVVTMGEADMLDGGAVLPGFSIKVGDIFKSP
jgi:Uma2 family endonuclease